MKKLLTTLLLLILCLIFVGCQEEATAESLLDDMQNTWEKTKSGVVDYKVAAVGVGTYPIHYVFNGDQLYYLEHYMLEIPLVQGSNGEYAWIHDPILNEHISVDAADVYKGHDPVSDVIELIASNLEESQREGQGPQIKEEEKEYHISLNILENNTEVEIVIDKEHKLPIKIKTFTENKAITQTLEYSHLNEDIDQEIFLPPSASKFVNDQENYFVMATQIANNNIQATEVEHYVQKLQELTGHNKYDFYIPLVLGDEHLAKGEYETAIREYEKVISDSNVSNSIKARTYLNVGDSHYQLGDIDKTSENYEKAARVAKGEMKANIHELVGEFYAKNENTNFDKAMDHMQKALNLTNNEQSIIRLEQKIQWIKDNRTD